MFIASVQVSWDMQAPIVLGAVILITIVVIAGVFGHQPISSPSRVRSRNRPMPGSFDSQHHDRHYRIHTTPRTKSPKNPKERRAAFRREGNPVWVIVADCDTPNDQFFGAVLDRSTGGLCLSLPQEIFAGKFLNVRAVNSPPDSPWITVEVRHSKPRNDRWITGCKFQRKFLWCELHSFG